MKLNNWGIVLIGIVFFVSSLFAMGNNSRVEKDVFYVLYSKKEKVLLGPGVKPNYYMKTVGDYYLLGKMEFDDALNINAEFFDFTSKLPSEAIEDASRVIDLYNLDSKTNYLNTKNGRSLYVKTVFSVINLERFNDNKLGKKYFETRKINIPANELNGHVNLSRKYK
jgi:hypothetical protein